MNLELSGNRALVTGSAPGRWRRGTKFARPCIRRASLGEGGCA
ncbi:MAG: hypothetical protein QGH73_06890 [Rhodospirillales bacterium]|nr:hypothetical protein [Rhodospirillales bacterium]MDP6644809.1 hypothetical protein [Rhodospirillales bacterium]MDP6841388.1 hypothetical protein [Rhodospirillales bacterium]